MAGIAVARRLLVVFCWLCVTLVLAQEETATSDASPESSARGWYPGSAAQRACQILQKSFPQLVAFPGQYYTPTET